MLFNSFEFLLFFPVVVIGYYIVGGGKFPSNIWLLFASYYFYLNLNPVYGILLLAITGLTYGCARYLEKVSTEKAKKQLLTVCLLLNFSSLFIFKYYNFVNESIYYLMNACGLRWDVPNLKLLLPEIGRAHV